MENQENTLPTVQTEATKPLTLKSLLEKADVKKRFEDILGARAGQFCASLIQISNRSAQLSQCSPSTIIGSAITAAALNLSIDPNLGHAHLVPYNSKDGWNCQFQIGWKGLIQLAQRSGLYKSINATEVYEGELVKFDKLSGELSVDQNLKTGDKIIGYAAKFVLLNGFEKSAYWTKDQIEKHAKRYSKSFANRLGPWTSNFDQMAIKTVLKDLLKWGPQSIEIQTAITRDQAVVKSTDDGEIDYIDNPKDAIDITPETAPKAQI